MRRRGVFVSIVTGLWNDSFQSSELAHITIVLMRSYRFWRV